MTRLDERMTSPIDERDLRGHGPMLAEAVRELLERTADERRGIQRAWVAEVHAARERQDLAPCQVLCMREVAR